MTDTTIASFDFEHDGRQFTADLLPDYEHGAPWDEEDGHGPVSEWTSRAKEPGEWVLSEDRGRFRYYDFAEACRIARRDGWGCLPGPLHLGRAPDGGHVAHSENFSSYHPTDVNKPVRDVYRMHRETMTPKQYAAACARHDFERLRAWCNDEWCYVVLRVRLANSCPHCADAEYLGGVGYDPADDNAYIMDCAQDLACEFSS